MNKIIGILVFIVSTSYSIVSYAGSPASMEYVNTQIQNVNTQIQNLNTEVQTLRTSNAPITYTAGSGINITGTVISAVSSSPTTYTLGQYAQGGVIFWLDPTREHGLVVAVTDQDGGSGVQWYNGSFSLIGTFAEGVFAGQANTAGIIASQGAGTYAASICDAYSVTVDGVTYNDWYLPSKTELDLIWLNRAVINTTALAHGGTSLALGIYWSSFETNSTTANGQDFGTGAQSTGNNKSTVLKVRAIRAF